MIDTHFVELGALEGRVTEMVKGKESSLYNVHARTHTHAHTYMYIYIFHAKKDMVRFCRF